MIVAPTGPTVIRSRKSPPPRRGLKDLGFSDGSIPALPVAVVKEPLRPSDEPLMSAGGSPLLPDLALRREKGPPRPPIL